MVEVGGQHICKASEYENGTIPIKNSAWVPKLLEPKTYKKLTGDITADIVVVGAGLVGASVALHLAEQKKDVVVIESKQPAFGASGRNAGHIRPYTKSPTPGLDRHGLIGKFFDFFAENKDFVNRLCEKHGIDAHVEKTGYLEVSRRKWSKYPLINTEREWKKLGFNVSMIGAEDASKLSGSKENIYGLFWEEGGSVNPYLFTNGMITAAAKFGCRIYGDSPAVACNKAREGWILGTPEGSIRSQTVVFCTNGHANNIVFPELSATNYPLTACAMATKPVSSNLRSIINPSRAALAQRPVGLAPLVIDQNGRLITAQIPDRGRAHESGIYFSRFLRYLHRAYPETKGEVIELESYWTGRTYGSNSELPQLYQVGPGLFALINTGSSGNLMGPLIGRHFSDALLSDLKKDFLLPVHAAEPVHDQRSVERMVRLLIPAARFADRLGII